MSATPVEAEPDPRAANAAPAGLVGLVRGRVVDGTGLPFHPSSILIATRAWTAGPYPTRFGEFAFDLAPGTYRFDVEVASLPPGYLAPWNQTQRSELPLSTQRGTYPREIEVPEEGGEQYIELRVFAESVVTGRVADFRGAPVEGAAIALVSLGLPVTCYGKTGAGGGYEVRSVYPGRYRTEVSLGSAADVEQRALSQPLPQDFDVAEGETVEVPVLVAGGGTKVVRGRVVNQDGEPFPGIFVLCYLARPVKAGERPYNMGASLQRATTDEDGAFELAGLPDEIVAVQIAADWPSAPLGKRRNAFFADPITVDLREGPSERVLSPVTLAESRPYTFRGRVVIDPERAGTVALEDIRVQFEPLDPDAVLDSRVTRQMRPESSAELDRETGEFVWMCETPQVPFVLTLSCGDDAEPVRIVLEPRPFQVEERTIPFP